MDKFQKEETVSELMTEIRRTVQAGPTNAMQLDAAVKLSEVVLNIENAYMSAMTAEFDLTAAAKNTSNNQ